MKTKSLLIMTIVLVLALSGCTPTSTATVNSAEETLVKEETTSTTSEIQTESSTSIELSDSEVKISGEGAEAKGSVVTISSGGSYIISGSLSDGQIIVSAPKTTKVELILNGADITSSTNAPIYIAQADDVTVTLAKGSENSLTDSANYTYANAAEEEPDATLFSKVDLTINGTGKLTINGNFNNGIGSKDDLVIESGDITITAPNHGIRGRDSLTVLDGSLNVTAGNDGLQSNNDEDVSKGWISLEGGTFSITSGHDGIQAETKLSVSGGDFNIVSGEGVNGTGTTESTSDSFKGIKSTGDMTITGGEFVVDSYDDSIHSNSNIAVSEAIMKLSTSDDGIHADGELTISSGTINVLTSYEGLEASVMNLVGGDISVVATDDGINVAGGTDETETEQVAPTRGGFGADTFSGANSNRWLYIKGGNISVDSEGDGIDVNGNTEITGGNVYVSGPTNSGNGGLDYDGTFDIKGGVLVVAGSDGMALAPTSTSSQLSLMVSFSASQNAESVVELKNHTGAVLATYTPNKSFNNIVFSIPELVAGEEVTLVVNGKNVVTKALGEGVTAITDTGEERIASGFGGGMGGRGGGMPPSGERPAMGGKPAQPPAAQ